MRKTGFLQGQSMGDIPIWVWFVALGWVPVTVIYLMARRRMAPAVLEFLTQTNYRCESSASPDVNVHAALVSQIYGRMWRTGEQVRLYRTRGDTLVRFAQSLDRQAAEQGGSAYRTVWSTEVSLPPEFHLQVVDKDPGGRAWPQSMLAAIDKITAGERNGWNQLFSHPAVTGDRSLDDRFAVFATNPEVARRLLAAPAIKGKLLDFGDVDLTIGPTSISFNDSLYLNFLAAQGGYVLAMTKTAKPGDIFRNSIPLHDHLADLFAAIVQAAVGPSAS